VQSEGHGFSEQEVANIVRHAAELQEEDMHQNANSGAETEAITRAAAELGIQPQYVTRAIAELSRTKPRRKGSHAMEEFEQVVDTELDRSDYDVFLSILQPAGLPNKVNDFGGTISGFNQAGVFSYSYEVISKRGQTRVKMKSFGGSFAAAPFLICLLFAVIAMLPALIMGVQLWQVAVCLALLTLGTLGTRWAIRWGHQQVYSMFERAVDAISPAGSSSRRLSGIDVFREEQEPS